MVFENCHNITSLKTSYVFAKCILNVVTGKLLSVQLLKDRKQLDVHSKVGHKHQSLC